MRNVNMHTSVATDQSTIKNSLGKRIQFLRTTSNLTQEALAFKSGLTRTTIADIEKGTANPTLEGLTRIASAFRLNVTDLFSFGVAHQSTYIMQPTGGNLYTPLEEQLTSVQNGELNIQVAYAKSSGVDLLTSALQTFRNAGGYLRVLSGIDQKNTTAEALYKLKNLCDELYVVHDNAFAQTYHPKVFIVRNAEQAWVAVGSNNLTRGGLCTNYETCHTQILNLNDTFDLGSYKKLTEAFSLYQVSNLVKRISSVKDIQELLHNGLVVTEQQSRQNSIKRSNFSSDAHFGHRAISNLPAVATKMPIPSNLFTSVADSNPETDSNKNITMSQTTATLNDSEVTVASFHSLKASSDVQETYWFEMRASTGGSKNILDLSSTAKLRRGTHPNVKNGLIPGSVAFFGLDPMGRNAEKNITVVYNGIAYYPSTVKFTPNNASWRIQLKGKAETGNDSLSQYGKNDFANHILVFHRITSDSYILETMAESELTELKESSEFWATNGSNSNSKAFGKIYIG